MMLGRILPLRLYAFWFQTAEIPCGKYGAFFLSKLNLSFVFIITLVFQVQHSFCDLLFKPDIRFSSSTFVLFMLDVRSLRSRFV